MERNTNIVLSVKCAPEAGYFRDIKKAGIKGVELYLSKKILKDADRLVPFAGSILLRMLCMLRMMSYRSMLLFLWLRVLSARVVVFQISIGMMSGRVYRAFRGIPLRFALRMSRIYTS